MIDAIQVARDLTVGSGLSQEAAEAIVQTIVKMQAAELATKTDLAELRVNLIYWIIGSVGLSTLIQVAASFMRR